MAPQFGLDKAPEILYRVNVAAVIVSEHLRVQNQRDLLPDNLPQNRPHHIGHRSGVHKPAAASGAKTVRICLAQLGPTDGCGLPQSSFH
jgi:hypothetical protein